MTEKDKKVENIDFDVEKVKNQLYEITYIIYLKEDNSWISIVAKFSDFGLLQNILHKIKLRHENYLITDIKLIEPTNKVIKGESNEINRPN